MTRGMEPGQGAWFPRCQAQGLLRADSRPPRAPQELKLKDEECERLSKVREQLEQELEELTASLFEVRWPASQGAGWALGLSGVHRLLSTPSSQEAHKMVREANMKQAASEKQLKEARGKVRPPPAQARSELPPASQPASPAFLLPNQTLKWPGGAPRDGRTEVRKGGAEMMRLKFHGTAEIFLEWGPSRGREDPVALVMYFPSSCTPFTKQKPQSGCGRLSKHLLVLESACPSTNYEGWAVPGCWGPLGGRPGQAPRRGHLTESRLTVRAWASHVASLSLSFPIYKTDISVPISKVVPGVTGGIRC